MEIFVADESFPISSTHKFHRKFIFRGCFRRGTLVTCHIALGIFSLFAKLDFFVKCTFFNLLKGPTVCANALG